MEADRLSQLIGLIYDAAVDLDLWPLLLQGLTEQLEAATESGAQLALPTQVDSIERLGDYVDRLYEGELADEDPGTEVQLRHFDGEQAQLIRTLLPHFKRALDINRQFVELTAENQAFSSVLERLPIGMAIVDADGRLYAKNRRLDEVLKQDCGLAISQGRLVAAQLRDAGGFRHCLAEVAAGFGREGGGQAIRLSGSTPASVMVLPLPHEEPLQPPAKLMVFVSSLMTELHIEAKSLQDFFGLTRAEARLTLALVNGQDLNEISERYHVTRHTLRAQLRSIYAKTECSRQAQLVVKVLTSPLIVSGRSQAPGGEVGLPQVPDQSAPRPARVDQYLFLADGRRLSFAEYGPEGGYPTIMTHGLTGSRLQVHPEHDCLYSNNIRLIIPDRPGYGRSDSLEERGILDWNRDLEELVGFLKLERFALLGYSVGGSFALAAAKHFGERIGHLSLVSSMGRYRELKDLDGMLPVLRILLGLGRYTPPLAMSLMRLITRGIRNNPERYFERVIEQTSLMDKEVLGSPEIRRIYTSSMLEAARQGERDMMLEQLMMARDWGFSLQGIDVPTTMWHGEEDRHVPLHMSREIHRQLGNARLRQIPGGGHFLIFRYWPEIIADLARQLQGA